MLLLPSVATTGSRVHLVVRLESLNIGGGMCIFKNSSSKADLGVVLILHFSMYADGKDTLRERLQGW